MQTSRRGIWSGRFPIASTRRRHLIRDVDEPAHLPAHHRRHVRRASRAVEVELCADPLEHRDDWVRLYEELVARRGLFGVRAFSRQAFQRQLALPGLVAMRAIGTVG